MGRWSSTVIRKRRRWCSRTVWQCCFTTHVWPYHGGRGLGWGCVTRAKTSFLGRRNFQNDVNINSREWTHWPLGIELMIKRKLKVRLNKPPNMDLKS